MHPDDGRDTEGMETLVDVWEIVASFFAAMGAEAAPAPARFKAQA